MSSWRAQRLLRPGNGELVVFDGELKNAGNSRHSQDWPTWQTAGRTLLHRPSKIAPFGVRAFAAELVARLHVRAFVTKSQIS
jgi:hypothetical protein